MDIPVRHHAASKNIRLSRNDEPRIAIIGIDFGTSYTKVFCNVSNYGKFAVNFDVSDDCFLPSVLYYDASNNTLSLKGDGLLDKVEYFKYGLISNEFPLLDKLAEKNPKTRNNLNLICSVFFLATLISLVKKIIVETVKAEDIKFNINMGCPIENFADEKKGIYDKAVNVGLLLSQESSFENFSVDKIDEYITEHENVHDSSVETIPELYAEALWFIEQPSTGKGIYSILDVGGGTTDCATITVSWEDGVKTTRIYTQSVMPLGVEVLLKELYPEKYRTNRDECVKELREMDVIIPQFGKGFPPLEKTEHKKAVEFRRGFFGGIMEAKQKDPKLMQEQYEKEQRIPYFTFGGGADINFFHSIIKNHDLRGTNIPVLQKEDVKTQLESNRLIIAEQLARPYFAEIKGFPWHFVNEEKGKEESFEFADYTYVDT